VSDSLSPPPLSRSLAPFFRFLSTLWSCQLGSVGEGGSLANARARDRPVLGEMRYNVKDGASLGGGRREKETSSSTGQHIHTNTHTLWDDEEEDCEFLMEREPLST